MSFGEVPWTIGPEAPPREVVEALRLRALTALIYADVVDDRNKPEAAEAREVACQLRCQAAVVEALSAAYDELGLKARLWGEFAEKLRRFTYPQWMNTRS
jgi:hypothetical protein